jgi:hypothetical protein
LACFGGLQLRPQEPHPARAFSCPEIFSGHRKYTTLSFEMEEKKKSGYRDGNGRQGAK